MPNFDRIIVMDRRGQSLIEILLAGIVGSIMVAAAVMLITPALRSTKDASQIQTASDLGKQLLQNVRIWSDNDWHNISNLGTSSANVYYLNNSGGTFTVSSGLETVSSSGQSFTRAFYLDDVSRNPGDDSVNPAGVLDPSTKKVTILYSWPGGPTSTLSDYLTRSNNAVFVQADWSGGVMSGPASNTANGFASATNANTTGTGSVIINGF